MNQSEIFTSIKAVGIEFEGLWYKYPNDLFKEDGSVEFDRGYEHDENCDDYDYCDCEQNDSNGYVGEVASNILYSSDEIKQFFNDYHPHEVNHTCGLHIHISLNGVDDYSRLCEKSFYKHFKKELVEWGSIHCPNKRSFFDRLSGHNDYCLDIHVPERQLGGSRGQSRYSILNYCWQDHGTIECRVLPMFSLDSLGLKAVMAVLQIYENYLSDKKNNWTSEGNPIYFALPKKFNNHLIEEYSITSKKGKKICV